MANDMMSMVRRWQCDGRWGFMMAWMYAALMGGMMARVDGIGGGRTYFIDGGWGHGGYGFNSGMDDGMGGIGLECMAIWQWVVRLFMRNARLWLVFYVSGILGEDDECDE